MAKKQQPRDHARYQRVDQQGRIIQSGITKREVKVRESELRRDGQGGNLRQVGPRVTESTARAWEKQQRKGTPPGGR